MSLSIALAQKILQLMNGEKIAASKMKNIIVYDLIKEGILHKPGKRNSIIQLVNKQQLQIYLQNHFQINNLELYVKILQKEGATKTELIAASNDSKTKTIRSFKGFLVNCYQPVKAVLNNENIIIQPKVGIFNFIYDFENFKVEEDVTIVGIENPTNFRYIEKQEYLFKDIKPLFVSRYPQNQCKDLIKWLQSIPNQYLHFGDFDFAGINIYLNEFKKYLSNRANYFVPEGVEKLISKNGSKTRYDIQKINFSIKEEAEKKVIYLIEVIHQFKKGLDQEIFIKQ